MALHTQLDRGLGWIILDEPPTNALLDPVFGDLDALRAFLDHPDLEVAVLRGAGRHFSSGAAPEALQRLEADPDAHRDALAHGRDLIEALASCPVPLVAMIRGSCLGGGLEIALAAHFRIASDNALFGVPEANHGLMPGLGGIAPLRAAVGRAAAVDLLVTGRVLGAEEARDLGLVQELAPTRGLESRCEAFARSLVADRSPRVVRSIMAALNNTRVLPRAEALAAEAELFLNLARHAPLDDDDGPD